MPREIIITGSESYLGSVLGPKLMANGYNVEGIDAGFITNCKLYDSAQPNTIYKDVRDLDENDLKGTEVLVHLAGISNDPFGNLDAEKVYNPTREYSIRLARMCKKLGIKFIFASSCSVYGRSEGFVDENSQVNPLTPYSVNKIQIENDLKGITDKDFTPIIFRFATATGLSPRMRFDLAVNAFTGIAYAKKKLVLNSDGKAWRPYVAVEDICKAVECAIKFNPYPGEHVVLNVGTTSQNYDVTQIVNMIQTRLPETQVLPFKKASAPNSNGLLNTYIQDGVDIRDYRVSFEKILRELPGFSPDITISQVIDSMISKFRELGLDEQILQREDFYRLKRFGSLLKNGEVTEDLRWTKR